jgi:hypothetical protein
VSLHELAQARTVEWYTPPEVFERLGLKFDMDVASPMAGPVPWVPADAFLSPRENGLVTPWQGIVWCNPPYGRLLPKFAHRMVEHGSGILLLPARTETRLFQATAPAASAIAFPRLRMHLIRGDGYQGRAGYASLLMAFGPTSAEALRRADFGWTIGRAS